MFIPSSGGASTSIGTRYLANLIANEITRMAPAQVYGPTLQWQQFATELTFERPVPFDLAIRAGNPESLLSALAHLISDDIMWMVEAIKDRPFPFVFERPIHTCEWLRHTVCSEAITPYNVCVAVYWAERRFDGYVVGAVTRFLR